MKAKQLLDFEIDRGTNSINLFDLKNLFNFFPYAHPYRIYYLLCFLSLRPQEPIKDITWNNFHNHILTFRPHKQKNRNVLRKIKIPNKMWEELMYYKNNNFFIGKGYLFNFKQNSISRTFNIKIRPKLKKIWQKKSGVLRQGNIAEYYFYTTKCFRCTMATLIFYFYNLAYNSGDLALNLTCKFMGHSTKKMTATYYIKRIDHLGLDKFPKLPLLELMDHVVYNETQTRINDYDSQMKLFEY